MRLIHACFEWQEDLRPVWAWREGLIGKSVDAIGSSDPYAFVQSAMGCGSSSYHSPWRGLRSQSDFPIRENN